MAGTCISNSLGSFSEIDSISCCFFFCYFSLSSSSLLSTQHAVQPPAGWCSPSRLVSLTLEFSTNKLIYLFTPFLQYLWIVFLLNLALLSLTSLSTGGLDSLSGHWGTSTLCHLLLWEAWLPWLRAVTFVSPFLLTGCDLQGWWWLKFP